MKKLSEEKKPRKVVEGSVRSKERTKQKLIDAVGEVLKEKGYSALTINNIAQKAKVDRRLISLYFGSLDNLLEEYLNSRDYWMTKVAPMMAGIVEQSGEFGVKELIDALNVLYDSLGSSAELQKMLVWQVSEDHPKLRELAERRDKLSAPFFEPADKKFEGSGINLRAIVALQIAGIYFISLHAKMNKAPFCEIQVETEDGKAQIKQALETIMGLVYEKAKKEECN